MPDTVIIADDLTGALDTGVVFASERRIVQVAMRPVALDDALRANPDVLVVNSATRECAPEEAARAVAGICDSLSRLRVKRIFKKIDSRMRGNIATELAALRRLGITNAIIAPAIPEFGRTAQNGILSGEGLPEPVDMRARLQGCGLQLDFPDIAGQADFLKIPAEPPPGTVLAGARSLAIAIAGSPSPARPPVLPGPLLAAIGSRDPASRAQIARFVAAGAAEIAIIEAPDGITAEPAPLSAKTLLYMSTGCGPALDPATACERFADTIADYVPAICPATLFLCGGETALAALDRLRISVLQPYAELVPGVPVSRAIMDGRDLTVITKSGGFGAPELLLDLFGLPV